ncbi:MAG: lipoate--protein ligase [Candidatus Heimdallarchaeaceae archaeon]
MTEESWRLLNLQEIPYYETQTIYHALAQAQNKYNTPNTLIITWPDRPFVSIGLHQIKDMVIEEAYLKQNNIPYVRRVVGGGSVYLDANQIFYQIICNSEDYPLQQKEFYSFFLQPVVNTYRYFGIPAKYEPVNDVVALNRKISGNGAVTIENSKILVGNFILDFPAQEMSKILKVSQEKFRDKIAKSLEERMGSFRHFLGYIPDKLDIIYHYIHEFEELIGIKLELGELMKEERELIDQLNEEYRREDWINYVTSKHEALNVYTIKSGTYFTYFEKKLQGGLVQLFIHFEKQKIKDIVISGDFSIDPPFSINNIEQELLGLEVREEILEKAIEQVVESENIDIPGVTTAELVYMIIEAYNKTRK